MTLKIYLSLLVKLSQSRSPLITIQVPIQLISNILGRPRGFAFVEYEDNEDAEAAIDNFDETELFGRIVKVKPAKPYKDYRF